MEGNPLSALVLFHVGPVPITKPVVTTWVIMAVLVVVSWLGLRRASVEPTPLQSALEIVVDAVRDQIEAIIQRDSWTYVPLLATLFIFLVVANIVFLSVHFFGIKRRGLGPYLRHYTQPSVLLTPLNVLSEITRTFSLMVRLFGNMMSHEFVLAIVVFLAGLLVPIPFMLLGVLIGIIQAYIFTVLAAVFIGAAVGSVEA
jgi:F-type H+-transporting ATPase subunit a